MLDKFERKVLRKIYGPVKEDEAWRIRYNHELYQLYKEPPLSTHIKLRRLQWAGHVQRMPEHRVAKKAFSELPGGKRGAGRPRARWEDGVARSTQEMGRKNWRRASEDRDGWRRSIEEAKARFGP